MSESSSARREHMFRLYLPAPLYLGVATLMGKLQISKPAAILLSINQGLYDFGAISEEDYKLLDERYRRKLVEIIAERKRQREPSHVPVIQIQKAKAKLRERVDYSSLSIEQLQERYNIADSSGDNAAIQFISFEAKKRGLILKK